MGVTWDNDLSVGNALIDSDHKNLLVVVNRVEHDIRSRDRAAFSKSFALLDFYMQVHFRNEEKIAGAVNFPFNHNKIEHLQILHEMNNIKNILDAANGIWPDHMVEMYSHYLSDWMCNHIINEDMLLKPVLQTYPYDFKPDD